MKLTNLIVSCVAVSAVLFAAPAEAKDKHHKHHKHHHDKSCHDDHHDDHHGYHSYYGRSYYPGGSYYAPGTEPPGWYDRSYYGERRGYYYDRRY